MIGRRAEVEAADCPAHHTAYGSQALATNAGVLHTLAHPHCPGLDIWPHRDHWHIGHRNKVDGKACKRHPEHVATKRRLKRLGLL